MELLVDFSDVNQNLSNDKDHKINEYTEGKYCNQTTVYYKAHRIQLTDPITFEELNYDSCYKYYNIWNPYTGDILGIDPIGPLCFNPLTILMHIYEFRLINLWCEPSDEKDGYYEGYYGESVGAGDDFEIIGRRTYPERYLFRIPITDCYLPPTHKMNYVTMGAKLSDNDVREIDRLIEKYWTNTKIYKLYYKKIGSLHKLKRYYDIAISKNPLTCNLSDLNIDIDLAKRQEDPNFYINRVAVEELKYMGKK